MDGYIKAIRRGPAVVVSPETRFGTDSAERACAFHRSFPEYAPTPLTELKNLAAALGVKSVKVKDESFRFGLNAFKSLGGSYCVGRYIAKKLGCDISEMPYDRLVSDEVKSCLGDITFVTATDGNHGRGIAWTANRLRQKSVVYMPKGSSQERLDNIRALGAEASITDLSYDDAVRLAKTRAEQNGWVLVQDTSWPGYEEIPTWIMQGYTTMGLEITKQLHGEIPTHIFLQAGVGAMSGAMTGFFADYYGSELPTVTIVEPNKADCLYRTAEAGDGSLHKADGRMDTIMAGLACGEPCGLGWNVLLTYAKNFVSIPDYVAAKGMRVLGNPLAGDQRIISGESGAACLGLVAEVLQNKSMYEVRGQLGLDQNSSILCISTEGDTDKESYRKIVWDGFCPSF